MVTFLGTILLARILGSAGQGDLTLYMNLVSFSILIIGLGLSSSIGHFIASNKIEKGSLLSLLFGITGIGVLVIASIWYVLQRFHFFNALFPNFFATSLKWLWVIVVHLLFLSINAFLSAILQAENRFQLVAKISSFSALLLLILYAIIYFNRGQLNTKSMLAVISSLLLIQAMQTAIYLVSIWKKDQHYFHFAKINFTKFKPLFQFSALVYLANLFQFFSYKMDIWFLNYVHHDIKQIGVYALAAQLAQLLWLLPNASHGVLYVSISSNRSLQSQIELVQKTKKWLWPYAIGGGIIGFWISIFLVPILFGQEFSEASKLIGILLFGIIPIAVALPLSAFFAGLNKVHINLKGSAIGLVVSILFNLILIPPFKMYGAAIASAISYSATVLYYFYQFNKFKKLSDRA